MSETGNDTRVILSGSRAIKHWHKDFPRKPKDWDFIVDSRSYKPENRSYEFKHIPPILEYLPKERKILNSDEIFTLKCSHLFWDINWSKHMEDAEFLAKKGAKIIPDLFHKLYDYWNKVHGKNKRSKLDMNKDEFFNNLINYEIDHDHIHTLLNPTPVYTKILKDGAEVEVDENKFHNLPYEEKLALVREEVYVMAWERGRKTKNYKKSYVWMLKKFIMYHAPLWEAMFIFENYEKLKYPEYNYFEVIEQKLNYDRERV